MWCVVYEAMYQKKWNPLVVALVVLVCYYLLPLLAYNDYWEVPEHSTDLYILLYLFGGVLNTIILYYASRLGGNQCH